MTVKELIEELQARLKFLPDDCEVLHVDAQYGNLPIKTILMGEFQKTTYSMSLGGWVDEAPKFCVRLK